MIKKSKRPSQLEKSINTQPSNPQKIAKKQKSKNVTEKKISSSHQKQQQLKMTKNYTESKFGKKRNHNSISSKEDVTLKFINHPKINKLKSNIVYYNTCENNNQSNNKNNNNNNNKLLTSNLFLTNDTDTPIPDEEKKNLKKNKFVNNNEDNLINLPEIDPMFKKNTFKKTIIIDTEGNNNLHMNIKKGDNDYKKILNNKNNKTIFSNSINANTESNSLFTNDSKIDFSKFNINNNINKNFINLNNNNEKIKEKENEIKKNIIDDSDSKEKNEEEKRIKEYTKIFNLLNTNIEQFKKMFTSKTHSTKVSNINREKITLKNNNNLNNPKNKNKKTLNPTKKQIHPNQKQPQKVISNSVKKNIYINNNKNESNYQEKTIKKNLSEKNLSSSSKRLKATQNIFTMDVRNDIEKDLNSDTKIIKNESNNAISSFLESSLQDDFYQSLMNRDFSNLNEDDKIIKDDIISINIDEKGKDENIQDIQNSKIFKAKFENDNTTGESNKNEDKKDDKNNCFIF